MATTPQNAAPLPQIDMSTSVPLNQPIPDQASTALPKIDMSTSVPLDSAIPASAATPEAPGLLSKIGTGIQQFAAPIVNLVKPAETPTEHLIQLTAGDGALGAYRAAQGLVASAQNMVKAGPDSYTNALSDFKRMHEEFANKDYRNAASSAASLATDAAHILDPTMGTNEARELTEGARPGGNLATPLVRQGLTAGAALLGARAAGAEGAAASAADEAPSAFQRLIVNPFRKIVASPSKVGQAVETDAATAAAQGVAGSRSLLNMNDVETPYVAAKKIYQTVDNAAGTDLDTMYTKLANAQDRVMQTVDGSAEESKALADVKAQEDAIAQVKARAKAANPNLDVDGTLAQADKKFTEAQANKEFNFKFAKAVEGKSSIGVPESVKTDGAIRIVRDLTEPTPKYPTPRAYQTTMGKAGADNLLKQLYAARKAGESAVTMRTIYNWIGGATATGGAAALGYEATH